MINSNQQYDVQISIINTIGNDIKLQEDNIMSITLYENILSVVSKIEIEMVNIGGLIESNPITDKSKIFVQISSITNKSSNIKSSSYIVNSEFTISNFYASSDGGDGNNSMIFSIVGYQSVDLFTPKDIITFVGSSDIVIEQVGRDAGYNVDIRCKGSEDIIWYQVGNNFKFINYIADRAYAGNDGVFIYSDINKKLIYTTLSHESSKKIKFTAKYDAEQVEMTPLMKDDIIYYNEYNILNNVEVYNNFVSYGISYSYYDMKSYNYDKIDTKDKMVKYFNKSKKYKDALSCGLDCGLIGDNSLFETIYRGKIQNIYYKYSIFSNSILLNINSNTNVKLFDIVDLELQSIVDKDDNASPYSGKYYIGSIVTNITKGSSITKRLLLCRNGINKIDNKFEKDII